MHEYEAEGRALCQLRGVDPDSAVAHGAQADSEGFAPAILLHSPLWMFAAQEVKQWKQIELALHLAKPRAALEENKP